MDLVGDAARVDELLELGLPKRICNIITSPLFIIQVKQDRLSFVLGNGQPADMKMLGIMKFDP